MLAARDQENLVHGHQAAAASKPLNQGTRQLAPKTPGNKAPKTPFKVPLNDENGGGIFGGGKTSMRMNGKGIENFMTEAKKGGLADKNAFVTPIGPRARAPLGLKTTNAKANKLLQTPAPGPVDNDLGKTNQKSVSARKAKPRVSHAEMTKLEVLGDKDELEEREIEYMPPRPKDLPDLPDDHEPVNLSVIENGGLMRGAVEYFATRKGEDGLSNMEREQKRQQEIWDRMDKENEASMIREMDSYPIPCAHELECSGDCIYTIEARKAAEEQYQKTMTAIAAESHPRTKKPASTTGPSTIKSKSAAAALSQPKQAVPLPKPTSKPSKPPAKPRFNTSLTSRPKPTPAPTNPSSMRHAAATAASKTTMGYSKGRATSATLRQSVLPKKEAAKKETPDTSLTPTEYMQHYGLPAAGTKMWFRCKTAGLVDDDNDKPSLEEIFAGGHPGGLDGLWREEAEQDFQLTL